MAETLAKHPSTDKGSEKRDLRAELDRLENKLADLKVQYEQYFSGLIPLAPDPLHSEVKRNIRQLMKAPFKNAALNYRLRSIEGRYHTFNTYWQRVLRERENGTYAKDVFKACMREKQALEEARAQTAAGAAQKGMETLFNSYRTALEKQTGKKQNLDYEAFQKSLLQRARDFKEKHPDSKVSFKVLVRDGKVSVQLKAKQRSAAGEQPANS